MIRSPSFKPHFMPIRYGRASLISSSLFRLFASSFLLFCRSVSSARCPASSFSFFTAVSTQFAQIRKMGGAGAMLSMMPGMSGIDASQIDEKAFDRIEAMIYSMTKAEREDPSIINPKRKRRIAAGSGTQVSDVNKLLKQFEMMQKMMKQFKKSPKGFARKLGGLMGNPGAFRGMK